MAGQRLTAAAVLAMLALAACGNSDREPKLLNLRAGGASTGPDEFLILPTKPLQAPPDFVTLPPPTPGGRNLVDQTPDHDTVAALGGNPAALDQQGVPAADGALVAQAGRNGVQSGIRDQLAAEDLQFRRDNNGRFLERLFNVSVYYRSYDRQELDQHNELERLRRRGVRTPAAPPDPVR